MPIKHAGGAVLRTFRPFPWPSVVVLVKMGPSDSPPPEHWMQSGLVFNVQRFSLQDGPGLRSTVFMKGCPLACTWCHNPESQAPQTEFIRMRHRCMACGICSDEERSESLVQNRDEEDVEACP